MQNLSSLTHLDLSNTNLCRFHILHLGYLLENMKLPKLIQMDLGGNNYHQIQDDVGILLQIIAKHHQTNIVVAIQYWNLPKAFVQKVRQYANDSKLLTILADGNDQNETEEEDSHEVGEVARRICKMLHSCKNKAPLKDLSFPDWLLPQYLCGPILKALSTHTSIINLDLSGNVFGIHGYHLVNCIKAWGIEPSLEELDLTHCSLPAEVCGRLLTFNIS